MAHLEATPAPTREDMMPVRKGFRMKLLKSTKTLKTVRRPAPLRPVSVKPTTAEIVRAFKKTAGYEQILARIPKAATVEGWDRGTQVAYFSVCGKSGSAYWLDLWDVDHFDGFTDMKKSVSDCRAWYSHTGFSSWGSGQTATGRINCTFNASASAYYSCVVQLQSYPSGSGATVECLIDNNSFGNLPFTGTVVQPHFSSLSAGLHQFRVRQVNGSFFFLSLTVYRF
jgi:hypothetical protein